MKIQQKYQISFHLYLWPSNWT